MTQAVGILLKPGGLLILFPQELPPHARVMPGPGFIGLEVEPGEQSLERQPAPGEGREKRAHEIPGYLAIIDETRCLPSLDQSGQDLGAVGAQQDL